MKFTQKKKNLDMYHSFHDNSIGLTEFSIVCVPSSEVEFASANKSFFHEITRSHISIIRTRDYQRF